MRTHTILTTTIARRRTSTDSGKVGTRASGRGRATRASDAKDDEREPMNEQSLADVLAKLRKAEEEKRELEIALGRKNASGISQTVEDVGKTKPRARVDGVGRREELFTANRSSGDAWLRDGMEFLVREQPSEAGGGANGMTAEEKGLVNRRAIVGAVATAAFAIASQISIEAPQPGKPLFFYLVPIVRSRELLVRASALAEDGEWEELRMTTARVVGQPNDIKANLFDAAAYLSGDDENKAKAIAFDFLEYMEKVDYSKYYENMGAVSGSKAAEYAKFSAKASKSAVGKLDEFLALMDRESVDAAKSQVIALEASLAAESE